MQDLLFYNSKNSVGESIDLSSNNDIFITEEFSCFYLRNDSLKPKKILNISVKSEDNTLISSIFSNNSITLNDLSSIDVAPSLDYKGSLVLNVVLPQKSFLTFWLKKGEDTSSYNLKKHVNIISEWVDEH